MGSGIDKKLFLFDLGQRNFINSISYEGSNTVIGLTDPIYFDRPRYNIQKTHLGIVFNPFAERNCTYTLENTLRATPRDLKDVLKGLNPTTYAGFSSPRSPLDLVRGPFTDHYAVQFHRGCDPLYASFFIQDERAQELLKALRSSPRWLLEDEF